MSVPDRSYLGTPATAPGPAGATMLRHVATIVREPLTFLAAMRDSHGDVVQFPIPRPPTYLIGSADGAHDVLVARARDHDKDTIQYRSLALVTGDGLLTTPNERWRAQRPVVQPAFHRRLEAVLAPVVVAEIAATVAPWRRVGRPAVVDVEAAMLQLSLRVVGRVLFGDDLRGEAAALADATIDALEVVIQRSRLPLPVPHAWPTPANRKLTRSRAALDAAVAQLVRRRRAASPTPTDPPMLLDLLMASEWDDEQVRDQIVTFLVAGHETAASGLVWALWLLAGDDPAQGRCAVEPRYARASAEEALRLFPPAWVISRSAAVDHELGGYRIPAGALVIVSPFLLQRDPRYWGDPLEFRPDRMLALDRAERRAYLPFGAGPRLCIGRDFARWEMAAVLQQLCAEFRWARVERGEPGLLTGVTLRPKGGMRLAVSPRTHLPT